MQKQFFYLIVNFLLIFIQAFLFFIIYNLIPGFTNTLDSIYQHPAWVWLVMVGLLLYFLPTFVALGKNNKFTLQICLLNTFLGFTLIGWVGALIWSTINSKENKQNELITITLIIQIFSFLAMLGFCITDHNLYNYDRIDAIQDQKIQDTLEAFKTIQKYYR